MFTVHLAHAAYFVNHCFFVKIAIRVLAASQGCQMVCFQTKNPNLGKIFRFADWKMLMYYKAIWNILWTFGILYDHLVIWYIFPCFGVMHQEKSGKPAQQT
jgi:hypothetical protein